MSDDYYSESWAQATEKFIKSVPSDARLRWVVADNHKYDIPYVTIGDGPHKIVINSGVHGIEGYFGSAAQIMFLREFASHLSDKQLQKYTIALVHVINGWGMEHRMREVLDKDGGLVDLNRNFGVDFSSPDALPKNPLYAMSHDLLVSKPDAVAKKNAIKDFYYAHKHDGAWDAISRGQYTHPNGLFYGGNAPAVENKMTMRVYDNIVNGGAPTRSLISIGLHTGLGRFNRYYGTATMNLLQSSNSEDKNIHGLYLRRIFAPTIPVQTSDALLGDLVDCIEARYGARGILTTTADLEIGTGEYPIMSPIYKRMDMGDARYDLAHGGKINAQTRQNLTESWYPSHPAWRRAAMANAQQFWRALALKVNDISRRNLLETFYPGHPTPPACVQQVWCTLANDKIK